MHMLKAVAMLAVCSAGAFAQGAMPLEASLRRGVSEPSFYVDQPAYVAVFEVVPGQGVQQLYPRSSYQAEKPVEAGEYLLSRPFRSSYRYYGWNNSMPYARPMWMLDNRGRIVSYYYTTGWTGAESSFGMGGFENTRTLLLVAARRPLRLVSSQDAAQHWLQQVVGFRAIAMSVAASQSVLTDIVDAVLPMGTNVDDIVVDVLEYTDYDRSYSRMAGQSISFYCPTGSVSVPAAYFFSTGMFFCPIVPRTVDSPVTPTPPTDTTVTEEIIPTARKAKPEPALKADESAVLQRRGVIATPVSPTIQAEEGYRPYRPTGGATEEGYRSFGRLGTTEVGPRARIAVGVPVDPTLMERARVSPTTEAYVPYVSRTTPVEQAVNYRSRNSGGTYSGTGSSGSTFSTPSHRTTSTGSTTSSGDSQTASQAQAERSAASREAVSAARPAASKPVPPEPPR